MRTEIYELVLKKKVEFYDFLQYIEGTFIFSVFGGLFIVINMNGPYKKAIRIGLPCCLSATNMNHVC